MQHWERIRECCKWYFYALQHVHLATGPNSVGIRQSVVSWRGGEIGLFSRDYGTAICKSGYTQTPVCNRVKCWFVQSSQFNLLLSTTGQINLFITHFPIILCQVYNLQVAKIKTKTLTCFVTSMYSYVIISKGDQISNNITRCSILHHTTEFLRL